MENLNDPNEQHFLRGHDMQVPEIGEAIVEFT
jgi:hypothetical protein